MVATLLRQLAGTRCEYVVTESRNTGATILGFSRVFGFAGRTGTDAPAPVAGPPPPDCGLTLYCSWRLLHRNAVVGGSGELSRDASLAFMNQTVVGNTVESVAVSPGTYDLRILFEDEVTLDVFCDVTHDRFGYEENYVFFDRDRTCAVGVKSVVSQWRRGGSLK